MKTFNKYLDESHNANIDVGHQPSGPDFSNDLSKPETIERINSFLGALGSIEHLVAEHALNKLREKLGRLSISFDNFDLSESGGSYSMPLTQFGGRIGKDENGDVNDDGISHKVEGGLSIEIMHEKTSAGTHFIKARIV
jgi:hypothetical protein